MKKKKRGKHYSQHPISGTGRRDHGLMAGIFPLATDLAILLSIPTTSLSASQLYLKQKKGALLFHEAFGIVTYYSCSIALSLPGGLDHAKIM